MSLDLNNLPWMLLGTTLSDRPAISSGLREGVIFVDKATGIVYLVEIIGGVKQWALISGSAAPGTVTTVGASGAATTYLGGTIVPPTQKAVSFTASATEASVYEITATGVVATLNSTDAVGTRYEFIDLTGSLAPNFALTPNGGKLISGPGQLDRTSITLASPRFWRQVVKLSDGNWLMEGI